jgi:hypothetical protein
MDHSRRERERECERNEIVATSANRDEELEGRLQLVEKVRIVRDDYEPKEL